MLDNAKYGHKTILPQLRVIDSGIFKGYVVINPRWAGFKEAEYFQAAKSVYVTDGDSVSMPFAEETVEVKVAAGDFDLRGFEITRAEFFDYTSRPAVTFESKHIKFGIDIAFANSGIKTISSWVSWV